MKSRLRVSHSMLLNVLAREDDPFEAMRSLLRDNHEDGRSQLRLVRRAVAIHRTLLAAGVVERLDPPDESGRRMRLVADLPFDFALNRPLSTYALATFETLDAESPTYALDMVSVVEATLEDPRPVLSSQQYKARGEAVAEMKADGIEYDERMELLDEVSWPKPLLELLEATYELYRKGHPWIAESALSPKSVVRDMWERAMTFGEYVAFYGLTRSEGLVLRYLSDAYKALRQTVPEAARTEELADLIEWLGEVVRQTDSSLLDEWEQLVDPDRPEVVPSVVERRASCRACRDHKAHHLQRPGLPGPGPQRHVPSRRAARPTRASRSWRSLMPAASWTSTSGGSRLRTTSRSTSPSTLARTRAVRRCC